ncbi:hypothetical protein [Ferrovibrio xuzhouensis]|uniref:Secreted protein n=1 Tax=Ferrovibrio xuzhouensis TaxID=1576914 RepID=A0ABV7VE15_9PROT
MAIPARSFRSAAVLLAAAALFTAAGIAAATAQTGQAAMPRPTFCIMNQVNGTVTAEIRAGKATTRVPLPPGKEGCCVNFCSQNPAPAGYQVTIMAQPPGGISHELCKTTVKREQLLDVVGTQTEGKCATRALP